MKLDPGPQLEGPGLVVLGMAPGRCELWLRLTLVIKARQGVEDQRSRHIGRGVEHPNFQGIEPGDVELEANGKAAAARLGLCTSHPEKRSQSDGQGAGQQYAQTESSRHRRFSSSIPSVSLRNRGARTRARAWILRLCSTWAVRGAAANENMDPPGDRQFWIGREGRKKPVTAPTRQSL